MSRELPLLERSAEWPHPAPVTGGRCVYLETYGCQMNLADTEVLTRILQESGYCLVDRPELAEIVLLNTCAVREHAEERVIGRAAQLNGLRSHRPGFVLGILGCMAQHLARDLLQRAPFVDLVVGPDAYRRLPQLLAERANGTRLDLRLSRTEDYAGIEPVRRSGPGAWVVIMRGCNRFCSFCVVPFVRGRERSLPSRAVIRQIEQLAAAGIKEVTLLGQTVNSYRDGELDFAGLLRAIGAVPGIERIRFTSPHPADFDDRTIQAMVEVPQVCPSLHLPVQSGSDVQLERMRRGYTVAEYRNLVYRLRKAIPDLALTTDIVVGFCGETEEDFRQTCALMEEIRFDSAFMFKYSERKGTYAQKRMVDDVPAAVKQERLQQIVELQERISRERNQEMIGRVVQVLVEGRSKYRSDRNPAYFGRSEHGKITVFPQEASANALVPVRITGATSHTLFGDALC